MKTSDIPIERANKVIADILLELDKEIADYQKLYEIFYGKKDGFAYNMYLEKKTLVEKILKLLIQS